jgi:hypothetical protein
LALLTEPELGRYLTGFQRSAFRFEIRDSYNSVVGHEAFRRFLAGEPEDYAWHQDWLEMLRRDRTAGKRWQRVRIVPMPLSDWSRYGLQVARLSVAAGDDTRYLPRTVADQLGLAPYDAWIFDDEVLVHLHFNGDDTFVGAEVSSDRDLLLRHQAWRELAWQHAQPLDDFAAGLP